MDENDLEQLALKLKTLCGDKGREIDPCKSASIIHQIGLVHTRLSPEKIALIKAVGLLNAALVRNPCNASSIKYDLSELCKHILKQANAKDQSADLIAKAKYIKSMISVMRNEANKNLKNITLLQEHDKNTQEKKKLYICQQTRINTMRRLQLRITTQYKAIMRDLSHYCLNVMGHPPCKFAIAGMGSLARKEVTPYSDFEHVILLEVCDDPEQNTEYFRWLSVIFHTVVLNLQETIIPSLNVMFLNVKESYLGNWFFDTHTNGVSFDGMMPHACKFPLGRQQHTSKKPWKTELIKPVDKMLEYLSSDESLKNGYHLNDILAETCFVFGDRQVYAQFEQGIQQHKQSKTREENLDQIRQQIKEDLDKFSTRFSLVNLKVKEKLNIKLLFYRTSTLFVSMLGKIHGVKSPSGFDIINSLALQNKISPNTKHNLLLAVAIACEIRLRIYMKKKSQFDYFDVGADSDLVFDELFSLVDKSTIIRYFQITYCLQREICKLLNFKKSHTYSKAMFVNITICYTLGLYEVMSFVLKEIPISYKHYYPLGFSASSDVSPYSSSDETGESTEVTYFDHCMSILVSQINKAEDRLSEYQTLHRTKVKLDYLSELIPIISILLDNKQFGDALEFLAFFLKLLQLVPSDFPIIHTCLNVYSTDNLTTITQYACITNIFMAKCQIELEQHENAVASIDVAIELLQTECHDTFNVTYYLLAGDILIQANCYEKALFPLQLSLGSALSLNMQKSGKSYLVVCGYAGIGTCLMHLNLLEEAVLYLKLSVEIINLQYLNEGLFLYHTMSSLTKFKTYFNFGKCYLKLHSYENALTVLLQTLELPAPENVSYFSSQDSNDGVKEEQELTADLHRDVGVCFMKLNRFQSARYHLEKAFDISKKIYKNNEITTIRLDLMHCYMTLYHSHELC